MRRPTLNRTVHSLLAALLAVATTACTSCSASGTGSDPDAGEAQPHPRPTWSFYQPPSPLPPAPPGALIRSQPLITSPGVLGWRILYHSRGVTGADIAVSGSVFTPGSPPPTAGRPVVAWAHGTYGSGDSCAPSTDPNALDGIEDGAALIGAGDAVVATDYEGLGTPGPHPYLVGTSEAHAVLDAVRAATRLTDTGIGKSLVVFGHSQGAHAALFTGELAATYAPDLRLLGVAAAAPPTDLPALANHVTQLGYGLAYLLWVVAGYSAANPSAHLGSIMTPHGATQLHLVEDACSDDFVNALTGLSVHDLFTQDPRTTQPWSSGLKANSTGTLPTNIPALIMQGGHDPIILPEVTNDAVHHMCRSGDTVDYQRYPKAAHNVVPSATAHLNNWIAARFHGDPAPRNCGQPSGGPT